VTSLTAIAGFLLWWPLGIPFVLLFAFVTNFFRDPHRIPEGGENTMICPADGKVVEIMEVEEAEYIEGPALKISIFMNVFSVHVNRVPCNCRIEWARHFDGQFLNAADPTAGMENERTLIALRDYSDRPILLKQVAGLVARRIICPAQKGEVYTQAQRFGMIRFGSRVEMFLPKNDAFEVSVRLGQKVYSGKTVLGEWL
jgi:phosphatidylserine decarboxylase